MGQRPFRLLAFVIARINFWKGETPAATYDGRRPWGSHCSQYDQASLLRVYLAFTQQDQRFPAFLILIGWIVFAARRECFKQNVQA